MNGRKLVNVLIGLILTRGVQTHIRSEISGEFIARLIGKPAAIKGVEMLSIEPSSLWKNGYAESFHSRLRDELLNAEEFVDMRDTKLTWPDKSEPA